jgi:hypothetical protein
MPFLGNSVIDSLIAGFAYEEETVRQEKISFRARSPPQLLLLIDFSNNYPPYRRKK